VFVVPSLFKPLGLVAFEAASRWVPSIATPEVGALPHLLEFGASVRWDPPRPLSPIVLQVASSREKMRVGARAMQRALGSKAYADALLKCYSDVLASHAVTRGAAPFGV
jgi:hypothetical protein